MADKPTARQIQAAADASREQLREFLRAMTTKRLAIQRGAYENDLRDAQQRKGKGAKHTAQFNADRIALVDQVLGERHVTVDEARRILDEETRGNK